MRGRDSGRKKVKVVEKELLRGAKVFRGFGSFDELISMLHRYRKTVVGVEAFGCVYGVILKSSMNEAIVGRELSYVLDRGTVRLYRSRRIPFHPPSHRLSADWNDRLYHTLRSLTPVRWWVWDSVAGVQSFSEPVFKYLKVYAIALCCSLLPFFFVPSRDIAILREFFGRSTYNAMEDFVNRAGAERINPFYTAVQVGREVKRFVLRGGWEWKWCELDGDLDEEYVRMLRSHVPWVK